MYDPNIAPTASFEDAAQALGVHRARSLWAAYDVHWKQQEQEADAIELCMARDASKKTYIVNEELGGAPEWRMAPHTYLKYHRASLPQKGCNGGEFLDDTDFMRYFLKRFPQCKITAGSGKIMSGWTPQKDAVQSAFEAGKQFREHEKNLRSGVEVAA